ncbi:tripartite ATP-independent transporter DctM subunit [Aliiruegeria haliotis]|uniref:TRAP transporter large permease protein n=1 Tax=Aliiruegeria haliotis TaxID=1280846 RepID=A0A2T0RM87_9RHOB|nr:TRAP transporter large permease [Aliiruegeria haliotis]PRY22247.1 tripartite ATP-independent transporter DctM subunit [Aliiruegeria haliotis]
MILAIALLFAVLTLISTPIAIGIGISVAIGLAAFSPFPAIILFQKMVTGIDSFVLVAIPLFILMGNLMNSGGITDRIFAFMRSMLGHKRAGLAQANVGASLIFSGMSGSAVADAAGLGAVEIKAMKDQGYDAGFSAAVTTASSAIGPIIPPSIPFVLYGAIAEVSVGQLFMAGIIPGLLLALSISLMIAFMGRGERFPRDARVPWSVRWHHFRRAALSMATPAVVLVGIIGGVFTPTEAGAIGAAYALILSLLVYRTVRVRDLPRILVETMTTAAIVTFIISTVSGFSWVLAVSKAGDAFVDGITSLTSNPVMILLLINVGLLVIGALIEAGAVLILMTPILLPLAVTIGVDPVHFGAIMVLNLMIGVATPPVGMSLFVASHVADIPIERLMRAVLPFLVPLFAALAIVTYSPGLVMWLPRLVFAN